MPKKDVVAEGLARLAALRHDDDRVRVVSGVRDLLASKFGYVVARAANLAADRGLRETIADLVTRLNILLADPKSNDPGCEASLALVQALTHLEAGYEAEDVTIRATRYERWEPVYGGSVDSAVSVRGHAAILLAAMGSPQAIRQATELLAAGDSAGPRERSNWTARADAARALAMVGNEAAAAVLRFKLLIGDSESNVLCDCLTGLLTIERDAVFPLVERMLTGNEEGAAEAALLALGSWRDARAFGLLYDHATRFMTSPSRELFLASVAMTRQSAAIDFLLDLIGDSAPNLQAAAIKAMEPLRGLPGVEDRMKTAMAPKPADRKPATRK